MKQKDIVLIVVVTFVSAVFSLIISKALFSSPAKRQLQVEVVTPIAAEFNQPDNKYFNENSFNPTKLIQIGEEPNPDPLKSR